LSLAESNSRHSSLDVRHAFLSPRLALRGRRDEIDANGVPVAAQSAGPNLRAGLVLIPDRGNSKAMYRVTKMAAKCWDSATGLRD
jgi:hypothetical protein